MNCLIFGDGDDSIQFDNTNYGTTGAPIMDKHTQDFMERRKIAMIATTIFFFASAAVLLWIGSYGTRLAIAGAFIAAGYSQFAFQSYTMISQRVSLIASYIALCLLLFAVCLAIPW